MPGCIELSARNFRSDPPISSCCLVAISKPAETRQVETTALQLSIPGAGLFRPQVAGFEVKTGLIFLPLPPPLFLAARGSRKCGHTQLVITPRDRFLQTAQKPEFERREREFSKTTQAAAELQITLKERTTASAICNKSVMDQRYGPLLR